MQPFILNQHVLGNTLDTLGILFIISLKHCQINKLFPVSFCTDEKTKVEWKINSEGLSVKTKLSHNLNSYLLESTSYILPTAPFKQKFKGNGVGGV